MFYSQKAIRDFESYLRLFDEADSWKICGEITPSYLYYHNHTIENLKKYHPCWNQVKIIIILREPVDKVISQYNFVTNTLGVYDSSLEDALKKEKWRLLSNKVLPDLFYIDTSLYYKAVKAYMDEFKSVKVFLYDDLVDNIYLFLKDIFKFLKVDESFVPQNIQKKYNKSRKRMISKNLFYDLVSFFIKSKYFGLLIPNKTYDKVLLFSDKLLFKEEKPKASTIEYLRNCFRKDVKKVESLLKRDLSCWGY